MFDWALCGKRNRGIGYLSEGSPIITFEGAVVREQNVTFAVVVVKGYITGALVGGALDPELP